MPRSLLRSTTPAAHAAPGPARTTSSSALRVVLAAGLGFSAAVLFGAALQPAGGAGEAPAAGPAQPPAAVQPAWPDDRKEPALELQLTIDGKARAVELDKPFEVEMKEGKVPMLLTAKPWRTFRTHGVEFRYPRGHSFTVTELGAGGRMWTLNGGANTMMIMHLGEGDPDRMREAVVTSTRQQFAGADVESQETKVRIGGKDYDAVRLIVHMAKQTLHQDFVCVQGKDKSVLVFIIQDLTDDGTRTKETERVLKMLDETFKISGEPAAGER